MRFEAILEILYAIMRDAMSRNLLLVILFAITNVAFVYQNWQLQDHLDNLADSICYNMKSYQPD